MIYCIVWRSELKLRIVTTVNIMWWYDHHWSKDVQGNHVWGENYVSGYCNDHQYAQKASLQTVVQLNIGFLIANATVTRFYTVLNVLIWIKTLLVEYSWTNADLADEPCCGSIVPRQRRSELKLWMTNFETVQNHCSMTTHNDCSSNDRLIYLRHIEQCCQWQSTHTVSLNILNIYAPECLN